MAQALLPAASSTHVDAFRERSKSAISCDFVLCCGPPRSMLARRYSDPGDVAGARNWCLGTRFTGAPKTRRDESRRGRHECPRHGCDPCNRRATVTEGAMKRASLLAALLISVAGFVYLQTNAPAAPQLTTLMPSGALLVLESPDFGKLLRDWDESTVKTDWLASANFAVFSRSDHQTGEVYGQYGAAASLEPGLAGLREITGTDSALALYGIRDVEFLLCRPGRESALMKSPTGVHDEFERREAGGAILSARRRRVPPSPLHSPKVFCSSPLATTSWHSRWNCSRESPTRTRRRPLVSRCHRCHLLSSGELRLVMNLEALVPSTYFRSYWVQRNASAVRPSGPVCRTCRRLGRHVQREPRLPPLARDAAARTHLRSLALVPPEAGLYKASPVTDASATAALVVQKLIGPKIRSSPTTVALRWRSRRTLVQVRRRISKPASTSSHCRRTRASRNPSRPYEEPHREGRCGRHAAAASELDGVRSVPFRSGR